MSIINKHQTFWPRLCRVNQHFDRSCDLDLRFWGGYLFYNTINTRKSSKNSHCFPSQQGNPPSAILFILTAATAIAPHTKSYEIAGMTVHSVVKFKLCASF